MEKDKKGNYFIRNVINNHVLIALFFIAIIWVVIEIRDILFTLFVSYIIATALSPFARFMMRKRVPKVAAIVITYTVTTCFLVLLIFPLIPFITSQVSGLFQSFPKYVDEAARVFKLQINSSQINSFLAARLETIGQNAFVVTGILFGGIFSLITVLVVSFYLLLDQERIKKNTASLFPKELRERVLRIITQVEEKLGAWFRGQIMLSVSIGIATWLAYSLLGLEFALPLAILAGILEIVPTIGPILGAIPAMIVALSISPTMVIFVVLVYIFIQMLEANILVPKIMQRAVGINPIVIILAITIGARLMGIMGALLAIPFVSILIIIYNDLKSE